MQWRSEGCEKFWEELPRWTESQISRCRGRNKVVGFEEQPGGQRGWNGHEGDGRR